ncbi:MAG: bifunctional demethylmenaquinone methyltransferase/2-methoxy-6-polyprenyl-1,4-benzoquinol methylase UbiE [Verrucomicrobiales bacterium]|nr:bifunctional demethylmenaquinone methyltransferase/2-methoxy-6-polyprenyl-1,4-benzoquinol methylase UbiE [Verrucomicrobiales bacterium]|tara:strand:- start:12987 stop:13721 length:735 start_codon:yes stop_codon:yes gene_type:complete
MSTERTSYYQAGETRAENVRTLFDRIARKYDLINDVQSAGMHRVWKKWLWKLSQPKPGAKVLDLCCGTGDIAFFFAHQGCVVTGADFSTEMLKVARERSASDCRGKIAPEFLQADVLQLPFEDESFEIITIGYGLRNLADFDAGLKEMTRVLKPGGQLLILEFGKPDNSILRAAYYSYLNLAVPLFGLIFCGDMKAYAYILESLKHYPAQRGILEMLDGLGYAENRIENFMGGTMSINRAVKPG